MLDLWTRFDLPVLTLLVERLEVEGAHRVNTPLTLEGLTEAQVQAALRRLEAGGFIDGVASDASYPIIITSVTERALRAVGAWPTAEEFVDRLLASLTRLAEEAPTPEERSRARRVLDGVAGVGRDVLVNAAGSVLGTGVLGL